MILVHERDENHWLTDGEQVSYPIGIEPGAEERFVTTPDELFMLREEKIETGIIVVTDTQGKTYKLGPVPF